MQISVPIKPTRLASSVVTVLGCIFLSLPATLSACQLRVQVSDFPPYSYQVNGVWQGSRVVLSERLAQKLKCDVKFLDVPWARAMLLLRSGDLDLMFNMTPTPERSQFIWFTKAHHLEQLAFATTVSDLHWRQINKVTALRDFPGMIALTQGAYMGADIHALLQERKFQQKIIEVAERRTKNELVLRGRAQGLVEDVDYLRYAIANFSDYQTVFITPLILSSTPVYLGISKNSPLMSIRPEIEKALEELEQAGLWFSQGT